MISNVFISYLTVYSDNCWFNCLTVESLTLLQLKNVAVSHSFWSSICCNCWYLFYSHSSSFGTINKLEYQAIIVDSGCFQIGAQQVADRPFRVIISQRTNFLLWSDIFIICIEIQNIKAINWVLSILHFVESCDLQEIIATRFKFPGRKNLGF